MKKIELILLGMLLLLFLIIILNISIALNLKIVSTNIIKAPDKDNVISDSKHFPFSREAQIDLFQQKLHGIASW